ncbi:MAG: nuclear transport factor 2 family protein [Steroidobacteraceae bacterium]
MKTKLSAKLCVTLLAALPCVALTAEMTAEQSETAKWMIERARGWAEQACGGTWVLSELLADDFQGTSPKGKRYRKPTGEPPRDPNTHWSTDCRLDDADVHFFGTDLAVIYGAESMTVETDAAKRERVCLVWTDTWHRRNGKWQIVAVQDNRIDCPTG